MPIYSLYLVSALTQRLGPALELDVSSDEKAIEWAEEVRNGSAAELREGERLVRKWQDL